MLNAVGTLVCWLAGSCETSLDIRAGFTPLSPPLHNFFSSSSSLRHFSSYVHSLNLKSFIRLTNSYLTVAGQFLTHHLDIFLIVQIISKFSWHQPASNKLDVSQFMLSRMLLRVWQQGFPENDDNFKFPLQNFLWSHVYIWRNPWKTLSMLSSTSVFNIRHPQPLGSVFILK